MQYFKGDDLEEKMYSAAAGIIGQTSDQKSDFFTNCYDAFPLGELIYNGGHAPLAKAIQRTIFREAFNEVFLAFKVAGSFESYITVFKKIFGDDVEITFTVPAPGKLTIDIVSSGFEQNNFISRYISNNAYVLDTIVDDVGDNIVFQNVKGFESQYELEQMLFELVPAGIFTDINLTIEGI